MHVFNGWLLPLKSIPEWNYNKNWWHWPTANEAPKTDKAALPSDAKKRRLDQGKRCYTCGKIRLMSQECFSKGNRNNSIMSRYGVAGEKVTQPNMDGGAAKKPSPTCYFCNEKGYIATHCPKKWSLYIPLVCINSSQVISNKVTTNEGRIERRVDVCTIKPATDYLAKEKGEKFLFCFDSGSECSLLKESITVLC